MSLGIFYAVVGAPFKGTLELLFCIIIEPSICRIWQYRCNETSTLLCRIWQKMKRCKETTTLLCGIWDW